MRGSGTIACVFDFDETLAPDSTTKFLRSRSVDTDRFWGHDVRERIQAGFDPTLAWLELFLELVGDDKPLGRISNTDLATFGASLDDDLFPGLPALFGELRSSIGGLRDISIEFYVVSGGLRDLIVGSPTAAAEFTAVYGCEFAENDNGNVSSIKRCVTFTEKTRYLFEINKGIDQVRARTNPYLVNTAVSEPDRRVPFTNMIYVGDGLTDIPCFSLVGRNGGTVFGVFDPSEESKAKKALAEFLEPKRVGSVHSPRYGPTDDLGALLRAAVAAVASRIQLRRESPYA